MFMRSEYNINYSTSILHLLLKRWTILFVWVIIRSIYNKRSARGFFLPEHNLKPLIALNWFEVLRTQYFYLCHPTTLPLLYLCSTTWRKLTSSVVQTKVKKPSSSTSCHLDKMFLHMCNHGTQLLYHCSTFLINNYSTLGFFFMILKFKYFEPPVKTCHLAGGNGGAIITCVMSGSFLLVLDLCEYVQWNMGIMGQITYFKPS